MTDDEFIESFEAATLPGECFHHQDHVKMVWLYLHRYSVLATLDRFASSLKRFAAANGKPGLYHETITWAFVLLINERTQRGVQEQDWEGFVEANADLLDWKNNILKDYYNAETLASALARRVFVFPDKG